MGIYSQVTGTHLTSGLIDADNTLKLRSENNDGGVIFGDGIEADYLSFNWGMQATFTVASNKLAMVCPTNNNVEQRIRISG